MSVLSVVHDPLRHGVERVIAQAVVEWDLLQEFDGLVREGEASAAGLRHFAVLGDQCGVIRAGCDAFFRATRRDGVVALADVLGLLHVYRAVALDLSFCTYLSLS